MSYQKTKNPLSWIVTLSLSFVVTFPTYAVEFPSAPERDPPQSTAAGGRRGGCVSGNLPIKAFTPGDDNYITTTSSQPQLFVYLPKTKAKFLQFSLRGENGENLNQQEIPINNGDYVVKISIPDDVNLVDNKKYGWEVSLICNPMFINSGNYTKGIIEKIALSEEVKMQLAQNPETTEKAEIYASQNIWSETLALVYSVKNSQPQQWNELLTSVGLQDYADKEFYQVSLFK